MKLHAMAILTAISIVWCATSAIGQTAPIVLREGLGIPSVGLSGRGPIHTDAVEAQIVAGTWKFPSEGETVTLPGGRTQKWARIEANKDGAFSGPAMRGGYAAFKVEVASPEVRLLEASGHNMVYVNGEPRVGDVYSTGWTVLPIALKAGTNTLLVQGGRGSMTAKLTAPSSPALFNPRDLTLPDLILGEKAVTEGAIIVVNASAQPLMGRWITCSGPGLQETRTAVPPIPPLATRKVAFHIHADAPSESHEVKATLTLTGRSPEALADTTTFGLRVRKPTETRKVTFESKIDGSIQYYAINPAPEQKPGLALFLSLHGASVEAIGQADAYAAKTWGNLVAPTNRRPYGFDWEDWGRLDALEALDLAKAQLKPDPRRVYLTGHSMGGHGTWHIGVTYPDKFAAIGPSAGWISIFTYAGAARPTDGTDVQAMSMRPMEPSDTLSLIRNTASEGVYILHGGADDNVPVTEAREMKKQLEVFHTDLATWEQPGAGHWWGTDQKSTDEKYGAACVDWKPMFEFFAKHKLPLDGEVTNIDFRTADPGVSAWCHWAGIMAQEHRLKISTISLKYDPLAHRIEGTTDNVLRLCLRPVSTDKSNILAISLDGQVMSTTEWPTLAKPMWLIKRSGQWSIESAPRATEKNPERCGPFKQAFRNRMIFVYGTQGSDEENAWSYARARYDAEQFWYRGNGAVDVAADTAFHPSQSRDRSVILYGNADTNGAWRSLLADSPVQVTRKAVTIGGRETAGSDLACLLVRPRPGSKIALVGVVSGTCVQGMRLTDRLPYFSTGVEYPDCIVLRPEMLDKGYSGIVAAGFFGEDWSVTQGEFVQQ